MLVLSRRQGERILIGDDIEITVVRIGPNSIRIGIEAPKELKIMRSELLEAIAGDSPAPDPGEGCATGVAAGGSPPSSR